jgi:hypothetical protein
MNSTLQLLDSFEASTADGFPRVAIGPSLASITKVRDALWPRRNAKFPLGFRHVGGQEHGVLVGRNPKIQPSDRHARFCPLEFATEQGTGRLLARFDDPA